MSDWPLPGLLIVAACQAPKLLNQRPPIHLLPDEAFLRELTARYAGIPAEVLQNRELLDLLLPTLRADVRLMETYRHRDEAPLDLEILALGGTSDGAVPVADLNAWRSQTAKRFSARLLPGDHFFLVDDTTGAAGAAWEVIASRLREFASDQPTPSSGDSK